MRALRIEKFGPVGGLELREVEKPRASAGEVLVAVRAAGINPSDVKNASGAMHQTTLPRTPGRDGAGVVVEGAGLEGTAVWFLGGGLGFTMDGTHAEFVLLPRDAVRPKPEALTMEQAAGSGVPFLTAWLALVHAAAIRPEETLLVLGASGQVGSAAVQIAHWKGARVIGADRRKGNGPAEASIDTSSEDLGAGAMRLTNGKGADVVFDTVGGAMFEPCLKCLGRGGRQVAISSTGDRRVSFDLIDFYHNELSLHGVDSLQSDLAGSAEILGELTPGFESGALKGPEVQVYSLAQAKDAYELVASGKAKGKIVLRP